MVSTAPCPECGATNRVDAEKLRQGLQPVCGRCGGVLRAGAQVEVVTDARFDEQVLASPLPVLLDVWASWCMPCRGMEPVIRELSAELAGKFRVVKLDADHNPDALSRLRIQGIPTLIVFKGGQEIGRMVGARPKEDVLRTLAQVS